MANVVIEAILVQFRPGCDQSVLTSWEGTTDQLNGVNAINAYNLLVVTNGISLISNI